MPQNSSPDIAALIRQLDEPALNPVAPSRLVVATSWQDAAVPLTVLKAFAAIVPPDASVQLVFATPHQPTQDDACCVSVLAEGAGLSDMVLANLEVASFAEVGGLPYDTALVPNGKTAELITQVGGLITRMHDLVRREEQGIGAEQRNSASMTALRARLAAFKD